MRTLCVKAVIGQQGSAFAFVFGMSGGGIQVYWLCSSHSDKHKENIDFIFIKSDKQISPFLPSPFSLAIQFHSWPTDLFEIPLRPCSRVPSFDWSPLVQNQVTLSIIKFYHRLNNYVSLIYGRIFLTKSNMMTFSNVRLEHNIHVGQLAYKLFSLSDRYGNTSILFYF